MRIVMMMKVMMTDNNDINNNSIVKIYLLNLLEIINAFIFVAAVIGSRTSLTNSNIIYHCHHLYNTYMYVNIPIGKDCII